MKKLKDKKFLIKIAVFVLLTLIFAVDAIIYSGIAGSIVTQRAAGEFKGGSDMLFAQVSAFYKAGSSGSEENIYAFRSTLAGEYVSASLEAPAGGTLYKDGYSAEGKVNARGSNSSTDLFAIGVGGDWFYFHPLKLRSGSYIRETDLMKDGVLLDEEAAWRLFGGYDLEGLTVEIDEVPYVIIGVVEREKDEATNAAYGGEPMIFMHYSALNAISETGITEYELVGADPIAGFLKGIVEKNFPSAVTVENTGRFTPGRIFKLLGDLGTRSMRKEAVKFPYWENAAIYTEDRLTILLSVMLLLAVYPVISLIVLLVKLAAKGTKTAKVKLPEYRERMMERRYERKAGR